MEAPSAKLESCVGSKLPQRRSESVTRRSDMPGGVLCFLTLQTSDARVPRNDKKQQEAPEALTTVPKRPIIKCLFLQECVVFGRLRSVNLLCS